MGIFGNIFRGDEHKITQEDLQELVKVDKKAQIIDVRTPGEYRQDHINPCQNISIQEGGFEDKVKYLDIDRNYVLYCASGRRSAKARKKMQRMGFDKVFVLEGGMNKWVGQKKVK